MGGRPNAMTAVQIQGMRRFERIGCSNCHNGPMFSDYESHVLVCRTMGSSRNRIAASRTRPTRFERHRCAISLPPRRTCIAGRFKRCRKSCGFMIARRRIPMWGASRWIRRVRRLRDPDDEADVLIAFLGALERRFLRQDPFRHGVPSGLTPGGRIQ